MDKNLLNLVKMFYIGEPCRICGESIKDLDTSVFVGYSKCNKSRTAHKNCWNKEIPQIEWRYQ